MNKVEYVNDGDELEVVDEMIDKMNAEGDIKAAENEKIEMEYKGKKRTKKYTHKHKELFMALFAGTTDVDSRGKVIVGDTVWDWADPDVQYFAKKARVMKTEMENWLKKELEWMFGKL